MTQILDIPAPLADYQLAQLSVPAHLGPHDRLATPEELAADLAELQTDNYRATVGETLAAMLSTALGQVGYKSPASSNQHSKYNDWFAALYGSVYRVCAWCAIFLCWVGNVGAIPTTKRTAGALALVNQFPHISAHTPGALVGYNGSNYPDGHVELLIKADPDSNYVWAVGGNTTGGGQGAIGTYYTRRYLPGNLYAFSMPTYGSAPTPPPPLPAPGKIAVDGKFGPLTIDAMERVEKIPVNGLWNSASIRATQQRIGTPVDGDFAIKSVEALQRHVGAPVDGDWGPVTTSDLQTALNANRF